MTASRYEGKPFLRLLDCYVLDAIGMLDASVRASLDAVTPDLQRVYRRPGRTWTEIVVEEMEFPANMRALIAEQWVKNRRLAADNGEDLVPADFAQMFVDANFTR